MRTSFFYTLFIVLIFSSKIYAQSRITGAAYKASVHPATAGVIKAESSGNCFGPNSPYYDRLTVVKVSGKLINVYNNYEDCKAAGGKISLAEKKRLINSGELELKEAIDQANDEADSSSFAGINFGLGLAFTYVSNELIYEVAIDTGSSEIDGMTEATGNIRVEASGSHRAILMLESHIWLKQFGENDSWGHGPFIAIGIVGEEDVKPLSTYGLGYMVGKKQKNSDRALSVGLGIFIDTDSKVFGSSFEDGMSTSVTDPQELLVTKDATGVMLMFSSTF